MGNEGNDSIERMVGGKYIVSIDELVDKISLMKQEELTRRIIEFRGIKLDFTEEYLNGLSVDRLRHIYSGALTATIRR